MAAAFHGNVDAVRHLLSLGAKASLADAGGKSAALIAGMRGHRTCFAELQRAADEERSAGSRRKGGGHEDFVYDLYYFEPPTPRSPAARGGETVVEGQAGDVAPGKIGEKVGSHFTSMDYLSRKPCSTYTRDSNVVVPRSLFGIPLFTVG